MDDLQMSYMSIEDYNAMTQFGDYWQDSKFADLTNNSSEKPKDFTSDKWKDSKAEAEAKGKKEADINSKDYVNGFKMDWTPVQLETQSPNINSYKKESKELDKDNIQEDLDREIFNDTREGNVQYEQLAFDIKDYILEDFGKGSNITSGGGGNGGAAIRQKIVDYMHQAEARAKEGKLHYSQGKRMNHDDKAEGGIHFYDCSSLVGAAYKSAGIPSLDSGWTGSQYPKYTDKQGGLLFPISELSNAKPGDVLCFTNSAHPKTKEELQSFNPSQTVHTAIYIGDNKYIDTGSHHPEDPTKDCKTKDRNNYVDKRMFAFARPKELVEADSKASCNIEVWTREYHNIPDELWNASAVAVSNVKGLESNMAKYKYKDVLIQVSKEHGFDPLFIAAVCAVESSGNPMSGGGYPGIIQSSNGFQTTELSGIKECLKRGCDFLNADKKWLKKFGWDENNVHLLASTHNNGRYGTTDALGYTKETKKGGIPLLGKAIDLKSCKIPEVAKMLEMYAKKHQPGWSSEEKRTYACKVLRAYNIIYEKDLLGLGKNNSNFIRPVDHSVSSIFGMRNGRMHKGVDYACPTGTPIKASASGEVTHAETQDGYGQVIYLKHANGYTTRYAHLSDYKGRKPGDKVNQGDILCISGNTGVGTGPHLHFEIRKDDEPLNPGDHVPKSSKKNEKV